jgi:hypothetical protein
MYTFAKNLSAAAEWSMVESDSRVKRWAAELKHFANHRATKHDRDMAGRAVLIESEHFDEADELIACIASEAKMQFCRINPSEMRDTLANTVAALPALMPTLIYLTPGAWQGKRDVDDSELADEAASREFRIQLCAFLVEESIKLPLVFVTAARSVGSLDVSLRNVGHFDRRIRMPSLSAPSLTKIFMDGLGTEQIGRSFLENATKIGVLLQHEYADRRRRRIMQNALKRMAWQESRKLEFTDLLNFAVYGTCEVDTLSDTDNTKLRHCVHEAGHALITHIDSREKRPPVYCSVLKRDGIQGIVVPPYDGHERISEDLSYCDIEHKIRASLGGRAAEHLLLGANEASANGSSADVQSATQLASSLFRHWGHAPDISTDQHASSNLAVLGEALNINESARIEAMIREFLQKQFLVALQMLRHHRPYLEKIVATLMEKNVLFEDDFHALVQASDLTI